MSSAPTLSNHKNHIDVFNEWFNAAPNEDIYNEPVEVIDLRGINSFVCSKFKKKEQTEFLRRIESFQNLRKLTLDIAIDLEYINLNYPFIEEILLYFTSLEKFDTFECPNLISFSLSGFKGDSLPINKQNNNNLKKLYLNNCINLSSLPDFDDLNVDIKYSKCPKLEKKAKNNSIRERAKTEGGRRRKERREKGRRERRTRRKRKK